MIHFGLHGSDVCKGQLPSLGDMAIDELGSELEVSVPDRLCLRFWQVTAQSAPPF